MIIPGFELRRRGEVSFVVSKSLEKAGFRNAFSTRFGGVSPLPKDSLSLGNLRQDERANVIENRQRFLEALDAFDWKLITARQIHSADVIDVPSDAIDSHEPATGDALVTTASQALLAVQTADCLPILLADTRTGTMAAVHAGWRGTLQGIVARTVEVMQQRHDTSPADLVVALGPAIGQCCFEVGSEVVELFETRYAYAHDCFVIPREGAKAHLDLNAVNRRQLTDCGVRAEAITDTQLCTMCRNDLFFSYRKEKGAEKPVGRLMGVIGKTIRSEHS
jgi:YfiH family protein